MGCRFPGGANDPGAFWELLRDGKDAVTEIPKTRWDIDTFYDPDPSVPGKMHIRHGSFLDNVDQFDPRFFGMSPREAMSLDPQHRLLLEVSWESLENAGRSPNELTGTRTGVFIGIGQNDYAQLQMYSGDTRTINSYDGTGNGYCFASGRISHLLGLQGTKAFEIRDLARYIENQYNNDNITAFALKEDENNTIVCKYVEGTRLERLLDSIDIDIRE